MSSSSASTSKCRKTLENQVNDTVKSGVLQYYSDGMQRFLDSKVEGWRYEELRGAHSRIKGETIIKFLSEYTPAEPGLCNMEDMYIELQGQIQICYENFAHKNKEKKAERVLTDVRRVASVASAVSSVAHAVAAISGALIAVRKFTSGTKKWRSINSILFITFLSFHLFLRKPSIL